MYSEPNRAFNYAVLASIVLHAVLLFGFALRERTRQPDPPQPLVARLVEPPAAAPAPVRAAPQPEQLKPRSRPKPVAPKPLAKEPPVPVAESATPAAEPPAEEPAPAEMEPSVPATAPAAPVIAAVEPSPAAPAQPRPAEAAVDVGSLAQYRQQLILAAPRHKRYPRVARDNNWQGTVALRMVVSPNGSVASIGVTKTSGYDVLDQQAQEMFRNAARTVPVPPVLRGKEFALEVAATYYFTD